MRQAWLLLFVVGCVRAPDVIIVDRKTSLERQASGSFTGLDSELEQAGLVPRPVPVTAAELEGGGVGRALELDEAMGLPDALLIDALLTQRCVGEARDGTVALTVDACTGAIDVPQVTRMLERVNRNRRQLWQWLAAREPRKSPDEVQDAWRAVHLAGVVCGGQVQKSDGTWEIKRC